MLLARRLGLYSEGVVDFAALTSLTPRRIVSCLSTRRSNSYLASSDISTVSLLDEAISINFSSEHLWFRRVFFSCLFSTSVGRGGLSSLSVYFFLVGLARPYRFWRIAIKLPSRNQRTRSNAKTAARLEYEGIKEAFALLGIARVAIGREAGASAHRQKIKAKLKPKVIKVAASKKKTPVIRSRDTKKSA